MESVAFFLPLAVIFALGVAVVLRKSLAGDPTLKSKEQMFSGQ